MLYGVLFNVLPALIRNIIEVDNSVIFVCNEFTIYENAFDYALLSSKLDILRVSKVSEQIVIFKTSDVRHKCTYS